MIIKTASWFSALPPDHLRVGISRGVPRFGQIGKGYRRYMPLTPGNFLRSPDFTALYLAQLAALDPRRVVDDLMRIADGRIPVLCCFERVGSGQWCHRSLTAAWLFEGLGITVPELGHETLPQVLHPMRPPEMLL